MKAGRWREKGETVEIMEKGIEKGGGEKRMMVKDRREERRVREKRENRGRWVRGKERGTHQ